LFIYLVEILGRGENWLQLFHAICEGLINNMEWERATLAMGTSERKQVVF